MKIKYLTFLGIIGLILFASNYYYVSHKTSSTEADLEIIESETEIKVKEEEVLINSTEESYCEDLHIRESNQKDLNLILEPISEDKISDGQQISGCVYNTSGSYGGWSPFEAQIGSFHLQDNDGAVIASGPLSVEGEDWMFRAMDGKPLRFNGIINFDKKDSTSGVLILRNENASGEPQLDRTIKLPIIF